VKRINFTAPDASAGDPERIHGFPLTEPSLDVMLAPPAMGSEQMENIINATVDVTSMPGAYGSVLASRGDDDETEERWREFEVATRAFTILENKRAKNLEVKTPKWKVKSCHGLWKVDSLTDLTDSITAVSDTAPTAFRQMDKTVMALMRRWNYRQEYIDQYLSVGGLPMMVRQTLNFYQGFLHAVHQQSLRHSSTSWHDSSARVMLLHHSKKLQEVRQHSGTFFEFLVATYVYLREASKKKFQDLALLQGVHDRLDTIHPTASQAGSDSGTTKTSNTSLCPVRIARAENYTIFGRWNI
jgi:hypothetical protein